MTVDPTVGVSISRTFATGVGSQFLQSPRFDYLHREISRQRLFNFRPGTRLTERVVVVAAFREFLVSPSRASDFFDDFVLRVGCMLGDEVCPIRGYLGPAARTAAEGTGKGQPPSSCGGIVGRGHEKLGVNLQRGLTTWHVERQFGFECRERMVCGSRDLGHL